METTNAMKMRVIFTCETMEQLAVVWAMAKQTGLQPDIVPEMPQKQRKTKNPFTMIEKGTVEPRSTDRGTIKAWKQIQAHLRNVKKETRGHIESIISKARKDESGPRIVGLWIKSGTLKEVKDAS